MAQWSPHSFSQTTDCGVLTLFVGFVKSLGKRLSTSFCQESSPRHSQISPKLLRLGKDWGLRMAQARREETTMDSLRNEGKRGGPELHEDGLIGHWAMALWSYQGSFHLAITRGVLVESKRYETSSPETVLGTIQKTVPSADSPGGRGRSG